MEIFLLWHVHHAARLDGTPTIHRDESGDLIWDEQDGDESKIVGAYSTEYLAKARIETARLLGGFKDEPDCFYIDCYTLDRDCWEDGFVTVDPNDS